MHEVTPGKLWIGHAGDLRDPGLLERHGIRALVHVALEERLPVLSRELLCCHFPIVDGAGSPREIVAAAIETTASLIRGGVPTLVCCSAGMSRSPSIAAGALAVAHGTDPQTCLERVVRGRPHDVSPGLWALVLDCVRNRGG